LFISTAIGKRHKNWDYKYDPTSRPIRPPAGALEWRGLTWFAAATANGLA
jgi:hypothetical protein